MKTDNQQNSPLHERVLRQRATLYNMLLDPMHRVAKRCAEMLQDKAQLDRLLIGSIPKVPYVTFLYALDLRGKQLSANAASGELIEKDYGRDRSSRPYMLSVKPDSDMSLSGAYISLRANRPSVTAIQKIFHNGEVVGYLGADFDLRNLPITKDLYADPARWRQIKGDPSIRGQVFQQCRIESRLDENIDQITPVIEELVNEHGAFHIKLHYSSSRATLWLADDPYRYQILEFEDLVDPDICLAYPHSPYPADAQIPQDSIRPILDTFRHLRFADDTIYLRAGSINIFNGIVGLNFSCDGSHYIPFDQFLAKDSDFWNGMA